MPLTDTQKHRIHREIAPLSPQLQRTAPPERARLVREALERARANPTWEEWDACALEILGDDATPLRSQALRP